MIYSGMEEKGRLDYSVLLRHRHTVFQAFYSVIRVWIPSSPMIWIKRDSPDQNCPLTIGTIDNSDFLINFYQ